MSAQKLLTSRLLWQFGEAEGNEPMIDWQRYRNGNLRDPWNLERLARHRAAKLGYRVHRSRRRKGRDNAGNFMLLHKASSTVLLGSGFTATLEMVLEFMEREATALAGGYPH